MKAHPQATKIRFYEDFHAVRGLKVTAKMKFSKWQAGKGAINFLDAKSERMLTGMVRI